MHPAVKLFLLAAAISSVAVGEVVHLYLDDYYLVDYEIFTFSNNESWIEFNVTVNTLGWVGLGLNLNGSSMVGADLFIGGFNAASGSIYGDDYHGIGNYQPVVDASQDWQLVSALENSQNQTLMTLRRALNTGDELEDVAIEDRTTFVMWSYREDDDLSQMHRRRGSRPWNLVNPDSRK